MMSPPRMSRSSMVSLLGVVGSISVRRTDSARVAACQRGLESALAMRRSLDDARPRTSCLPRRQHKRSREGRRRDEHSCFGKLLLCTFFRHCSSCASFLRVHHCLRGLISPVPYLPPRSAKQNHYLPSAGKWHGRCSTETPAVQYVPAPPQVAVPLPPQTINADQ